ncbi:MAG: TrmH family RNA methyltransferase [Myxococcota bacterium]
MIGTVFQCPPFADSDHEPRETALRSSSLNSISEEPQGIAAILKQNLTRISRVQKGLWVAVERVRSPGNLGGMIRSMEAAATRGLIMLGKAADPFDPIALRGSMGSLFSQKLIRTTHDEFRRWKETRTCQVLGTAANASRDFRNHDYRGCGIQHAAVEPRRLTNLHAQGAPDKELRDGYIHNSPVRC